jgi:hypothetical protein
MRQRLELALAAEKEWESSIIVILGARLVRRARPGFVGWVIVAIVRRLRHYRRPVHVVTTLIPGAAARRSGREPWSVRTKFSKLPVSTPAELFRQKKLFNSRIRGEP